MLFHERNSVQNESNRFKSTKKRFTMSVNGTDIQNYLDIFQSEMSEGFQKCDHHYSKNGTISCIKCGKVIDDV